MANTAYLELLMTFNGFRLPGQIVNFENVLDVLCSSIVFVSIRNGSFVLQTFACAHKCGLANKIDQMVRPGLCAAEFPVKL